MSENFYGSLIDAKTFLFTDFCGEIYFKNQHTGIHISSVSVLNSGL